MQVYITKEHCLKFISHLNSLLIENTINRFIKIATKNIKSYFHRDNQFSYNSNNVYNSSRQKQNDRFFRIKIIIRIEKITLNDREFEKNKYILYDKKVKHK